MSLVIQVIVCIIGVIFAAKQLSKSADILAEKTGLGRNWVGTILLGGITSLPELATGISAILVFNSPNLAVGGILGSCLFNLLILPILDILTGPEPLLKRAQLSHGLAASLGCVMLGVAASGMILANTKINLTFGWINIFSILLILLYLVSIQTIAQFESRRRAEVLQAEVKQFQYQHISRLQACWQFIFLSVMTVTLGAWLAFLGNKIADVTGLGKSFIGAILLATVTSLPEVVASITAVRLNALDLAVSNIFGSNIFNLAILAILDLVYIRGNLWQDISPIHIVTCIVAMIMTSIAISGLVYHAVSRSPAYLTWDGLAVILLYISGMYLIYLNIV